MAVEEDTVRGVCSTPLVELLSSPAEWRASADGARARGMQLLWPAQGEALIAAYNALPGR